MAIEISDLIEAYGAIAPAPSPAPGTVLSGAGFAKTSGTQSLPPGSHPLVGVYVITVDNPCNFAECVLLATPQAAPGVDASCTMAHASDVDKEVSVYLAGALDDTVAFNFVIMKTPLS